MEKERIHSCNCSGCTASEMYKPLSDLPYRYEARGVQKIFSLIQPLLIPTTGVALIGFSFWAIIPIASLIIGLVFFWLYFCATCSYHHENVSYCGCFPKSILPYKKHSGWNRNTNIIGWPLTIGILTGPTFVVLAWTRDFKSIVIYSLVLIMILLLQSTFSCPNCRQRNACFLGSLTLTIRNSQK